MRLAVVSTTVALGLNVCKCGSRDGQRVSSEGDAIVVAGCEGALHDGVLADILTLSTGQRTGQAFTFYQSLYLICQFRILCAVHFCLSIGGDGQRLLADGEVFGSFASSIDINSRNDGLYRIVTGI